jgi:hypothetical protein
MSEFVMLEVRKLADRSGSRVRMFDAKTGQPKLVNPATPGEDHEPWPLLGVTIIGDPPEYTSAGMRWVDKAVQEGWAQRVGERAVARPGGPADAPWSTVHAFVQADKLVIHDHERGHVVYAVTRNPDKYDEDGRPIEEYGYMSDDDIAGTEVVWHYELELERIDG